MSDRSLHLHIADVASDYSVKAADQLVNIFVESALCNNDSNRAYEIPGLQLFGNDFLQEDSRTCYGTTVYIKKYCTVHRAWEVQP